MRARATLAFLLLASAPLFAQSAQQPYSVSDSQVFIKTYCQTCHRGQKPPGGLDLSAYGTDPDAITKDLRVWGRVYERVHEASMPPKGMPAPSMDERDKFAAWVETGLRTSICAAGIVPGPAPLRRLNRSQYSNTIRDLLSIQFDALTKGNGPADGANYLESGDPEQAAWYYSVALTLDRSSPPAEEGLAKARAALAEKR